MLGCLCLFLLTDWFELKNWSTITQVCLTALLVPERQPSILKDTAFALGFKGMFKKHLLVSGDLREWPVYKDPLRGWKRSVTIRAGSLKVTCKLLWSAGCGRTMLWVSRGRIHVDCITATISGWWLSQLVVLMTQLYLHVWIVASYIQAICSLG